MDQLRAQYPLLATNELNSVYNERMRAKAPQILSNQMALDTASANLNHFTQMASDNFDAYKT